VHLTSRQNPIVKRFREAGRARRLQDVALLDGPHLVGEALDAGVQLDVVAFASTAADGRLSSLAGRCRAAGIQVVTAPDSLIAAMSPVATSSGVVALARLRPVSAGAILTADSPQLVLLLDGVQDPGNVGAIIRVADACGATGVIAGPGTADPFGWKALRGSMGSAFRVPVATAASLVATIDAARAAGLHLFATSPRDGTPLDRADLRRPAIVLLGGEGAGLAQPLFDAADERLTIPMRPPVESLNVSIAAALVLYEAARQRAHVAV
jgi:TrmH family RNA methyltransferase